MSSAIIRSASRATSRAVLAGASPQRAAMSMAAAASTASARAMAKARALSARLTCAREIRELSPAP